MEREDMEIKGSAEVLLHSRMMIDILDKKIEMLLGLKELTESQESMLVTDSYNDEEFLNTISKKEIYVQELNKLDDGFNMCFKKVRNELTVENKLNNKPLILQLQDKIREITDLSVQLQALERRNKLKIEQMFVEKRKNIKGARLSNQTVTNYYKNMSKQLDNESVFYDKKK